jgi:hypothetical protein
MDEKPINKTATHTPTKANITGAVVTLFKR